MSQTSKKTNTAVAVNTNSMVVEALAKIKDKLKNLQVIYGATFRTNGESKLTNVVGGLNIHKSTNVGMLIAVLGTFQSTERDYNEAAKSLFLDEYPTFLHQGYTLDAWQFDIQLRISQIRHADNEAKLKKAEMDLQTFLSNDDKLQMLLTSIGGLF